MSATGNPRNKVALKPGHSLMDWIRLGQSGKDLTGVEGKIRDVTPEELSKHNKPDDLWIAIKGKVFNVTDYIGFHPGGEDELMRGVGCDASDLFDEVHKWVNYDSMLQKCFVGYLRPSLPGNTGSLTAFLRNLRKEPKKFTRMLSLPGGSSASGGGLAPPSPSSPPLRLPTRIDDNAEQTLSVSLPTAFAGEKKPQQHQQQSTESIPLSVATTVSSQVSSSPAAVTVRRPTFDWFQKPDSLNIVIYSHSNATASNVITSNHIVIRIASAKRAESGENQSESNDSNKLALKRDECFIAVSLTGAAVGKLFVFNNLLNGRLVRNSLKVSVSKSSGKIDLVFAKEKPSAIWPTLGSPLQLHASLVERRDLFGAIKWCKVKVKLVRHLTHDVRLCEFQLTPAEDGFFVGVPIGWHLFFRLKSLSGAPVERPFTPVPSSLFATANNDCSGTHANETHENRSCSPDTSSKNVECSVTNTYNAESNEKSAVTATEHCQDDKSDCKAVILDSSNNRLSTEATRETHTQERNLVRLSEDQFPSRSRVYLVVKMYSDGEFTQALDRVMNNQVDEDGLEMCLTPDGKFCYDSSLGDRSTVQRLVLLAAGSGLTPMIRILLAELSDSSAESAPIIDDRNEKRTVERSLSLVCFNKTTDDIILRDELERLQDAFPDRFRVHHVLSRPVDSDSQGSLSRVRVGHVSRDILNDVIGVSEDRSLDDQKTFVCVCGPTGFNRECVRVLGDMGLKEESYQVFSA